MTPVVAVVLGDVHLGEGGAALAPFLDRLAQRTPSRLVILGDLVDAWAEDARVAARFADAFARLRRLRAAGWRIDLVRGNREALAGRRLECATGGRLRFPRVDLATAAGTVRVVHGDRLCRDPGYRAFAAVVGGFWTKALQALLPGPGVRALVGGVRRRSRAMGERRAQGAPLALLDPRRVRGAARGAVRLVAGHIHARLEANVGGVDVILCGDWPDRLAQWVEIHADGRISRHRERL